ncbi:MAG: peptidylprolyl isomerase [Sulfuritalea sp.]|nr:peptidylprolyl isomerase [Sulfuritalea sp.]
MNRTLRHALLLAFAMSVSAAPAFAQKKADKATSSATFVTVNGKAVPSIRAEVLIAGQAAKGQPDSPELRKNVKEELVRREVLTQEAIKKGFDKQTEVRGQIDLARQGVLIGAYLNDYVKNHPVTEDMIKKEYDQIAAKMGDKEYRVRHILLEKEDEAKAIIARLKKGEKFVDLAKESKDPGSKDRGGDLDWAKPGSFVPPFSAAMVKLEKGKFTDAPVKSDFGWHVIQLDDTRPFQLPPLDQQAKGQIGQQLTQRVVQQHIDDLRAKAKVE